MSSSEVYTVISSNSSNKRVYHTTSDCRYYRAKMQTWEKETAEAWGLEPCSRCAGGDA